MRDLAFSFIGSQMNRDFQLNAEAKGQLAVAECSINLGRIFVKRFGDYRGKNADMSSDK